MKDEFLGRNVSPPRFSSAEKLKAHTDPYSSKNGAKKKDDSDCLLM